MNSACLNLELYSKFRVQSFYNNGLKTLHPETPKNILNKPISMFWVVQQALINSQIIKGNSPNNK